jgi:PPE-repeat protein
MNFAMLPPEINSGRMYSGPGSGPMIEAATTWDATAARLYDTATDYKSVTSKLADGWQGPAAMAMTRAAAPYAGWLNALAAQAEQTAAQAKTAASAYESALAAMVPPPVIEANRALRTSLATANCLGQSSPDIADAEADYEQMWAQDADAMCTYATVSADASTVTPFTSPPPTTAGSADQGAGVTGALGAWALTAAPDIMSAGYQVMSTIPRALKTLSSSPLTTLDAPLSSVTASLSKLSSLSAPSDFAIRHLNSLNKMAALNKAATLQSLIPKLGRPSAASTTGPGRGVSIGALSVPQAWATAAPKPVAVKLPRGWVYEPIHLVEPSEPPTRPLTRFTKG